MGLFDILRRQKPGGPNGVRARLEGAMSQRRLRGWHPVADPVFRTRLGLRSTGAGAPRRADLCLPPVQKAGRALGL